MTGAEAAILVVWGTGWFFFAVWVLCMTWETGPVEVLIGGIPMAVFGFMWPALLAMAVVFFFLTGLIEVLMIATKSGPYRY